MYRMGHKMDILDEIRTAANDWHNYNEGRRDPFPTHDLADWLERAAAEIARLRALHTETGQKAIEAAAENERLRATLKKIADYSPASTIQPVAIAREALGK